MVQVRSNSTSITQFDRITELQIETTSFDATNHSDESQRFGLLHVVGLPQGFAVIYSSGLGIMREYRGFVHELEKCMSESTLRFSLSDQEGKLDNQDIFQVSLKRFESYRAMVDRNRGRGRTAVRRVIETETHNSVADIFGRAHLLIKFGRNPVIQRITEEVANGYVMDNEDREVLIDEVTRLAPEVALSTPGKFGKLRLDMELVSLEVLIDQFERNLESSSSPNEAKWQQFFEANQFALQQLFSMPLVVERSQAHLRGADVDGRGSQITDFLCANVVTRSAMIIEIKTPATKLMEPTEYRGRGTAGVFAAHKDLSGSIAQVQSQMASVQTDLANRLHYTPELSIDPWNDIRGAVIVGRISALSPEQRDSFLRYRAGLGTVTVLTYDEVLERLKELLVHLKGS